MKSLISSRAMTLLFVVMVTFSSLMVAWSESGDIWALPNNVWRVTSGGDMIPGTNNTVDIGSAAKQVDAIYAVDVICSTYTYATDAVTIGNITGTNITGTTITGTTVNATTQNTSGTSNIATGNITALTVGSYKGTPVTVTANATLADSSTQVFVGSINGDRTYVLPTPSAGATIWLSDTAGNVNVNGNVTIDGAGAHTINGAANVTFNTTYGSIRLVGINSTSWVASELAAP